jgi:CIC family chloride channel protein
MNHAPITIHRERSVADLFALFQSTHLQGFPVMDNDEDLFGVITLQDMERTMQQLEERRKSGGGKTPALKDIKVGEVATRDPVTVYPDEPIWVAIRKMAPRDLARLPVIARHTERKLLGQISRSDILRAYQMGIMRKQQSRFTMDRLALRPEGGVDFLEVKVAPGCSCAGRKVAELPFHQSTSIVSINRGENLLIPNSSTVFQPGDEVTVFCRKVHREEIGRLFAAPAPPASPGE